MWRCQFGALWWRAQVKTSHEVKNLANPIEPKVASRAIDNLLNDDDLTNEHRVLHHHVDKALEQRDELGTMIERNFLATAAACSAATEVVAKKGR